MTALNDNKDDLLVEHLQKYPNFIAHYHHLLECHLNEDSISIDETNHNFEYMFQQMMINDVLCVYSADKCPIYLRNNRVREHEQNKVKSDDILCVYIDLLDTMHCYFMHSFDVGYRIKCDDSVYQEQNETLNEDIQFDDLQMKTLKSFLSKKRETLNNMNTIVGVNRIKTHKFCTDIGIEPTVNLKNNDEMKHSSNHDEIKHVQSSTDKIYQNYGFDKMNYDRYSFGQRYDYWKHQTAQYIKVKYCSLKAELVNNLVFSIDMKAFDETLKKCVLLLKHSTKIKSIQSSEGAYFGIVTGQSLQTKNILALKLYTDHDTLSYNFSGTWRMRSDDVSFGQVHQKNREFWNWSKILVETVNCYGTEIHMSKIKIFYHGVNGVYFDKFIAKFNSPTS
eukprot:426188_1